MRMIRNALILIIKFVICKLEDLCVSLMVEGTEGKVKRPHVINVLSETSIGKVASYYLEHKDIIDRRVMRTLDQYHPSEGHNSPILWKPEYWKWFLSEFRK